MGMTAAEKSFKGRVKDATAPLCYLHEFGEENNTEYFISVRHWGRGVDLPAYEQAFNMYGTYLELIGGDVPVEQHVQVMFPNLGVEATESVADLHHTFLDGPKKEES